MIMANDTGARSADSREEPMFAPGDLVHHRRYGYRGVLVAVDRTCQARLCRRSHLLRSADRSCPISSWLP